MNKILCVKPDCLHQNPNDCKFCQKCGNKLILRERFIPREILGEGGFGRTFLATDTGKPSQPLCVIKQFLPQTQGTVFNSLANPKRAPGGGRKPALRSIEEKRFPDVKEVIVDGKERPVQRPQNRERQNEVSH